MANDDGQCRVMNAVRLRVFNAEKGKLQQQSRDG